MTGRPPIWDDPEKFKEAVDAYFKDDQILHTWTGLALHLGFSARSSLNDYLEKEGFYDPIKKALLRIENKYEERMITEKNPTGSIFALKNFGWKDKHEVEQKTELSGQIKHTIDHSKLSDDALREIAGLDKP